MFYIGLSSWLTDTTNKYFGACLYGEPIYTECNISKHDFIQLTLDYRTINSTTAQKYNRNSHKKLLLDETSKRGIYM